MRTTEIYDTHCQDLGGPLHDHIATTFGIVCNSSLNACKYFHVMEGLVPDIMHDILEGSLELCLRHMLIHFIHGEKLFTLRILNDRLASIKYGSSEIKNIPTLLTASHLTPDGHLKQSGTLATAFTL